MINKVQVILLVLLLLCGWQLYESHQRERKLQAQVAHLSQQVLDLQNRLAAMDHTVESLRSESLPEMLRKANGVLQDAWTELLDSLERELDEQRPPDQEADPDPGETDKSQPDAGVLKRA